LIDSHELIDYDITDLVMKDESLYIDINGELMRVYEVQYEAI
jgi:hypothetical protein